MPSPFFPPLKGTPSLPYVSNYEPGYMKRAILAWLVLNAVLLFFFAVIVLALGSEAVRQWWATVPLLIIFTVAEGSIVTNTIGPVVYDWVTKGNKQS